MKYEINNLNNTPVLFYCKIINQEIIQHESDNKKSQQFLVQGSFQLVGRLVSYMYVCAEFEFGRNWARGIRCGDTVRLDGVAFLPDAGSLC